jgi:hypothetical protein
MWNWLLSKWDDLFYSFAVSSIKRKCDRNPGFTYLLELSVKEYRIKQNPSPELMNSTETFFDVIKDLQTL